MKKNIKYLLLAVLSLSMVACGRTDSSKFERKETRTTDVKASGKNKKESTTNEDKVSIDDLERSLQVDDVDSEILPTVKEYVGYYVSSYQTTADVIKYQEDGNNAINYNFELAIYDDGTYDFYVEREVPSLEGTTELKGQLYVENDTLKSKQLYGRLSSGILEMEYGELKVSKDQDLPLGYLDEKGSLLPVYGLGDELKAVDDKEFVIKDGRIQLNIYPSAYTDKPELLTFEKLDKRPKSLEHSTQQIISYTSYWGNELGYTDDYTYSFNNVNEFVQAVGPKDNRYKYLMENYQLADPKELKGYYTEDNEEVQNIQYALHIINLDAYFVYDGKYIYELRDGNKATKQKHFVRQFIDYTNIDG